MRLRGIDLFCGVGGFALGMQKAGIQIVRSMDFNADALEVHRANIKEVEARQLWRVRPPGWEPEPVPVPINGKFQRGQIHKSKAVPHMADLTAVIDIAPEIAMDRPDIIFGGPPCQAFSNSGKKKRDDDERSQLTEAFAILVASARPKYFVMENVKGLRTSETFRRATAIFKASGYGITVEVVKAAHYGVPQGRERMIVAGCLDETDGWFADYLHRYRSDQPMIVADLLGEDFGTPLGEFLLSEGFDGFLDPAKATPPKSGWFRERDRKRLTDPDVNAATRFYHATPGGESSARVHRIDRPSPTLVRTTMHELPSTYLPLRGEPVDLRRLYQPTFEEFSRIGGFPADWRWPDPIPEGKRRKDEEMMIGERDSYLMLANAVPPPLARAVGSAIADHHHAQEAPVAPVDATRAETHWCFQNANGRGPGFKKLERYKAWLRVGKGKEPQAVRQAISDLRKVKKLVASRSLPTVKDELAAFDKLAGTARMRVSRRSQLRRALRDLAEFETYQSVVLAGDLFPDDDEAYAQGEFHRYYGPQADIDGFNDELRTAPPSSLRSLADKADNRPDDAPGGRQAIAPEMAADLDDMAAPLGGPVPAE